jgi:hypothetical protein
MVIILKDTLCGRKMGMGFEWAISLFEYLLD